MIMRMTWGKLRAGSWNEFEKTYNTTVVAKGRQVKGLRGRWLLQDAEDKDTGFAVSLWESAADMKALIAYLRTLQPAGKPTQPPKPWSKEAKDLMAQGAIKSAKDTVAADKPLGPVDLGPKFALGRYITRVTCAECHGPKLEGDPVFKVPNLVAAGAYSRAEFETLMTKGVPSGGRKLKNPLMGEVARERFVHFTPHERDALYAYLKTRAEKAN